MNDDRYDLIRFGELPPPPVCTTHTAGIRPRDARPKAMCPRCPCPRPQVLVMHDGECMCESCRVEVRSRKVV